MRTNIVLILACSVLALSACEGTKKQLGLTREAPDEFAVVKRAPLAMPPDYTLRPPAPGAPRPQEQATALQAREAVFGADAATSAPVGSGDESLLIQAGANNANPNIRRVVDQERAALAPKEEPLMKKYFGIGRSAEEANTVDARAEAKRLKNNAATGKPVTAGETPSNK